MPNLPGSASGPPKTIELVGKAACLKYCRSYFEEDISTSVEILKLANIEIRNFLGISAETLNTWTGLTILPNFDDNYKDKFQTILEHLNAVNGCGDSQFTLDDFAESTSKYIFSRKLGFDWHLTQLIIDTELTCKRRPEHDVFMHHSIAEQVFDRYRGVYDIYYQDCEADKVERILKSRLRIKNLVKIQNMVYAVTAKLHMRREGGDYFPYDGYVFRRGSSIYLMFEENSVDANLNTRDMVNIIVYDEDPSRKPLHGIMSTVSIHKVIYSSPAVLDRVADKVESAKRDDLKNMMRNEFEAFGNEQRSQIEKKYPALYQQHLIKM